jgi:hypothetical protein
MSSRGPVPCTAEMALLFGKAFGQTLPVLDEPSGRLRSQNDREAISRRLEGIAQVDTRVKGRGRRYSVPTFRGFMSCVRGGGTGVGYPEACLVYISLM